MPTTSLFIPTLWNQCWVLANANSQCLVLLMISAKTLASFPVLPLTNSLLGLFSSLVLLLACLVMLLPGLLLLALFGPSLIGWWVQFSLFLNLPSLPKFFILHVILIGVSQDRLTLASWLHWLFFVRLYWLCSCSEVFKWYFFLA